METLRKLEILLLIVNRKLNNQRR